MSFLNSSTLAYEEIKLRDGLRDSTLTFGVDFLDDAMAGILRNDLILIGAYSGGGKTQACCNIALANVARGRNVHYIALEAEKYEIERRIKYQIFAKHYFQDTLKKSFLDVSFQNWSLGDFVVSGAQYEASAAEEFQKKTKTLFTYYKESKFDLTKFIETVVCCADKTDLIIVDHVHYFDYDDENENRAVKEIAKTARSLTLEQGKPMILVSHIRKRDRNNNDIAPGMEEFHGSSDLFKIATKAITLAPGSWSPTGKMETFFRIVKNRFENSVTRLVASTTYNSKEGSYEKGYRLGDANQKRDSEFKEIEGNHYPAWAKNRRVDDGSSGNGSHERVTPPATPPRWPRSTPNGFKGR